MTRLRKQIRRRKIHVSLPEDLIAVIENQFFDPLRDRPQYGIFATLITGLLKKWVADPSIYPLSQITFTPDDELSELPKVPTP
jgi:hypothetical protein